MGTTNQGNSLMLNTYTGDILTFVPRTEFEYFPEKYIDYCYACGNGRYLKTELEFTIVYLPKTKE